MNNETATEPRRTIIDIATIAMGMNVKSDAVAEFGRRVCGSLVTAHPAITSCKLSSESHDAVRRELNRRGFDAHYDDKGCMGAQDRL